MLEALAEGGGAAAQRFVGERHVLRLELVDAIDEREDPLQDPIVVAPEDLLKQARHRRCVALPGRDVIAKCTKAAIPQQTPAPQQAQRGRSDGAPRSEPQASEVEQDGGRAASRRRAKLI